MYFNQSCNVTFIKHHVLAKKKKKKRKKERTEENKILYDINYKMFEATTENFH